MGSFTSSLAFHTEKQTQEEALSKSFFSPPRCDGGQCNPDANWKYNFIKRISGFLSSMTKNELGRSKQVIATVSSDWNKVSPSNIDYSISYCRKWGPSFPGKDYRFLSLPFPIMFLCLAWESFVNLTCNKWAVSWLSRYLWKKLRPHIVQWVSPGRGSWGIQSSWLSRRLKVEPY